MSKRLDRPTHHTSGYPPNRSPSKSPKTDLQDLCGTKSVRSLGGQRLTLREDDSGRTNSRVTAESMELRPRPSSACCLTRCLRLNSAGMLTPYRHLNLRKTSSTSIARFAPLVPFLKYRKSKPRRLRNQAAPRFRAGALLLGKWKKLLGIVKVPRQRNTSVWLRW